MAVFQHLSICPYIYRQFSVLWSHIQSRNIRSESPSQARWRCWNNACWNPMATRELWRCGRCLQNLPNDPNAILCNTVHGELYLVAFGMPRSPILKDLGIPSFAYSGQVLSRAVLQRSPVFCCPVLDFSSLESLSSGLFCCWHPLAGWKLADVGTGHDWPCQKKWCNLFLLWGDSGRLQLTRG